MVNTDKEYMAGLNIIGKYWFPQRIMIAIWDCFSKSQLLSSFIWIPVIKESLI
jgi:hypothetical protein